MREIDLTVLDFDPTVTFTSGQTFRWKKVSERNAWQGIVLGHFLEVSKTKALLLAREKNAKLNFDQLVKDYFSFNDSFERIHESFPKDKLLSEAIGEFQGLRILRQEPWECLISFVCSINKNIPAISNIIERLSQRFGKKIIQTPELIYSFPSPESLARATKSELLSCGVGFRWRYISYIANQVSSGNLDLKSISGKTYSEARDLLISQMSGRTLGVGPKVADCVLLFSYHLPEAFPIDVWVLKCLKNYDEPNLKLGQMLAGKDSLTYRQYQTVHEKLADYFGKYCGYAQQYLYMKVRSDFIRNKAPV